MHLLRPLENSKCFNCNLSISKCAFMKIGVVKTCRILFMYYSFIPWMQHIVTRTIFNYHKIKSTGSQRCKKFITVAHNF